MSGTPWDFAVWNGQLCPGDDTVHNVFRIIAVQSVYRAAPTHQFSTREFTVPPSGIFRVLSMEAFEKQFAVAR